MIRVGFLGVMVMLAGCGQADSMADKTPQNLPVRELNIQGEKNVQVLQVQIADDDAKREKGLMFVKQMPQQAGMLFVWPEAAMRNFWMRNTFIPLDLLYIRQGKIVNVVAWAKPFDETGLPSGEPADMVLEVNGGWASAHDVGVGDSVGYRP